MVGSDRDDLMRRVLWISAALNLAAALLFAFPASAPAQLAGLPTDVPPLYAAMVAFLVALFGGAYAWLARRPRIDRPLVGFAAIGKAGVVAVVFALWLFDQTTARSVVFISGDLVLASLFAWWLFQGGGKQ